MTIASGLRSGSQVKVRHTFCAGERGSPGGPVAIAKLATIMAEDMQQRGVSAGAGSSGDDEPTIAVGGRGNQGAGRGGAERGMGRGARGRGRAAFLSRTAEAATGVGVLNDTAAELAGVDHVPTALELAADPEDLKIICEVYGSRAQVSCIGIIVICLRLGCILRYNSYMLDCPRATDDHQSAACVRRILLLVLPICREHPVHVRLLDEGEPSVRQHVCGDRHARDL